MSKSSVLSAARGLCRTSVPAKGMTATVTPQMTAHRAMVMTAAQSRLDKNRNILPNYRYELVTPETVDQAKELLYASYHPFEPLTTHLGLFNGPNSIPDMDRLVDETVKENLSLFARDQSNGKVMGVCINGISRVEDWTLPVSDLPRNFQDPKARIISAIRQEIHNKGVRIFEEIGTDNMFGIKMVGVDPSLRGKGMSTDIIRRSILLAGCLGFEGLKAEATAGYAQAAFLTIGFTPVVEIIYEDFEYEGNKVFAGIEGERSLILFQKKFFQSCLKHIV